MSDPTPTSGTVNGTEVRTGRRPRSPSRRRRASTDEIHTEASFARLFEDRFAGRLIYEHMRGRWLVYDQISGIWRTDETGVVLQHILELVEQSNAKSFESHSRLRGIEAIARSSSRIARTAAQFNPDPFLLGTPGGPVNLKTGKLIKPDPGHFITMSTACAPAEIPTPRWLKFLGECTGGSAELIRFLQQFFGYTLTADIREQCLLFVYGRGRNGKGVMLRAQTGILGEYSHRAQIETFTAGTERHPTEIAAMTSKRLVFSSETERGKRWAESRIKDITGGDRLRARFMRQDEFEFDPKFKLIISGNYEPAIENCDEAMRGRFHVVPFDQVFTGDRADLNLDAKLRSEWPGILQWAIAGCLDWQRHGLVIPEKVKAATSAYFERQDVFGHWMEQETVRGADIEDTSARIFRSWTAFAKDNGEDVGSQKSLAEKLQRAGFRGPFVTRRDGKSLRIWHGLKVLI